MKACANCGHYQGNRKCGLRLTKPDHVTGYIKYLQCDNTGDCHNYKDIWQGYIAVLCWLMIGGCVGGIALIVLKCCGVI